MQPIVLQNRQKIKTSVRFFRLFRKSTNTSSLFRKAQVLAMRLEGAVPQGCEVAIIDDDIVRAGQPCRPAGLTGHDVLDRFFR